MSVRALMRLPVSGRNLNSASHIARVQTSRYGRVSRALDNGAAVGEQSHLVRVVPEFQHEIIVPDGAVRLEAAVHFGEVDRPLALVDLHGIPAAQRDVGPALACKMDEIALSTGTAADARLGGRDFRMLVRPHIE